MKKILYLGLDPPETEEGVHSIHFPVICIVPRPLHTPAIAEAYHQLAEYTHILFTSKSAVRIFFEYLSFYQKNFNLEGTKLIAIGKATAKEIVHFGGAVWKVSAVETAEGVIAAIQNEMSSCTLLFWPHSALSRPVITNYFNKHHLPLVECIFYDTKIVDTEHRPALHDIQEIVFTSPSTVDGFLKMYDFFPKNVILSTIGPITYEYLSSRLKGKYELDDFVIILQNGAKNLTRENS